MVFATVIVLTNLLLAYVALAAPSLEASPKLPIAGRQFDPPTGNVSWYAYDTYFAAAVQGTSATALSGVFTVPVLSGSGSIYVFIGFDTYASFCDTALNTGVNLTISGGQVSYKAMYQWLPGIAMSEYTGLTNYITFKPSDVVKLTITAHTSTYGTVRIDNLTNGLYVTQGLLSPNSALCGQDAEWNVEAGDPLADFGTIVFSDAVVTTSNGNIGPEGANAGIWNAVRDNKLTISADVNSSSVIITQKL